MRTAFLFPPRVPPTLDSLPQAQAVDIDDYDPGRDGRRLFCTYPGCLKPVVPRHRPYPHRDQFDCFAHKANLLNPPFCPYRTESAGTHRLVAMTVVFSELVNKLHRHGRAVTFDTRRLAAEARIDISGLRCPVVLVYADPRHPERWANLDETELSQTLFVVTVADLEEFNERELRLAQRLDALAKRPILVIAPPESDRERPRFAVMARRSRSLDMRDALVDVGFVIVDWKLLFDLDLPDSGIFIKTGYSEAVERLQEALIDQRLTPGAHKVLRLLAKRLLVDGAAVEWAVFGQKLEEARAFLRPCKSFPQQEHLVGLPDLLRLPEDAVLAGLLAEDALLRSCYAELSDAVREAVEREISDLKGERDKALASLAEAHAEITRLESELAKKERELEQERARAAALRIELNKALAEITRLESELVKKERELEQERARVAALQIELDKARVEITGLKTALAKTEDQLKQEEKRQRVVVALATALALILTAAGVVVSWIGH